MFEPQFTITPGILNAIIKLENAKAIAEHVAPPYATRVKLQDRVKALNLFHLAHILGVNITLRDAEKLAEGRKLEIEDSRIHILTNFRNVLEFNRSGGADNYVNLDSTLLLHLNKIVLTDWRETWDVKFRVSGEIIDPNLDSWLELRDVSIPAEVVPEMITDITEWYKQHMATIHPLILVGIITYQLVQIMPFTAGNKLTIIAIADFLLERYGFGTKIYLPVVRNFDAHEDDYQQAMQISNRSHELSTWLEKFLRSLAVDATDTKVELDKIMQEEEKSAQQPFLDLNKRQLKILRYLQTIPTVKREDYCQMMEVSTMTAFRDLNDLVRKKLIKIEGQGRGTKYMLVSR
jgi:Fic family protein